MNCDLKPYNLMYPNLDFNTWPYVVDFDIVAVGDLIDGSNRWKKIKRWHRFLVVGSCV